MTNGYIDTDNIHSLYPRMFLPLPNGFTVESRVVRTQVKEFNKIRDFDATSELHKYLTSGYRVIMCNRIGDELEYILEKVGRTNEEKINIHNKKDVRKMD